MKNVGGMNLGKREIHKNPDIDSLTQFRHSNSGAQQGQTIGLTSRTPGGSKEKIVC